MFTLVPTASYHTEFTFKLQKKVITVLNCCDRTFIYKACFLGIKHKKGNFDFLILHFFFYSEWEVISCNSNF